MNYNCLRTIDCKQGAVRKVRFNVDGLYCLTSGSDKSIKLWNPHKGLFLKTYSGHGNEVLDACGSCDSSSILSGSEDKCVILWDVASGKPVRRLRSHASRVTAVKFNEESSIGISASHDNTVNIWDLKSHSFSPVQVLRDAKDSVTSVQVTDHEIISGSLDGGIRCYDIRMGSLVTDFTGDPVTCLTLTRDGQCFIASTSNSTVLMVDKTSGDFLSDYTGHSTGDYFLESGIDQTDSYIISCSTDGFVYCWDLVQGTVTNQLEHKNRPMVHSVSVHPMSKFIVTATRTDIYLWGETPMDFEDC